MGCMTGGYAASPEILDLICANSTHTLATADISSRGQYSSVLNQYRALIGTFDVVKLSLAPSGAS